MSLYAAFDITQFKNLRIRPTMMRFSRSVVAVVVLSCAAFHAMAQTAVPDVKELSWSETVANHYAISPGVVYGNENNVLLRLDVWRNTIAKGSIPTLMYIHGGGWMIGDKTGADPFLLPYLELGWNIVNVEYRLGGVSLAPAAVQDVRCALRWMVRNEKAYNIDPDRIVVSGHSAGGHLALMVGMLPQDSEMDSACPGDEPLKVAAVVDWYGIADGNDILFGPHLETYAVSWIGVQPLKEQLAKSLSPITYVRPGLPPVIMIHGDQDPTVPYSQSVALGTALKKVGVPNELVTISGGKHGGFSDPETTDAYEKIWRFLRANVPAVSSMVPAR
jgi:acetyl esterase/lipase